MESINTMTMDEAAPPAPRLGLRTCSVSSTTPFDAHDLGRLKQAGFDVAELSFNRPTQGVTHDDPVKGEALRRGAQAHGMTLVSHAPDAFWLSNPDRGELEETVRDVEAVVAGAAVYGVEAMVIHCCPGVPLIPGRESEQQDALVYALDAVAAACERARLRLAAETMVPGRLTSSVENLIAAVDRVGSPWVGICVDTNHTNLSQDLNEAVRLAGDRIVELHLNDNHFVKEEHLFPYEGAIDWPAFARAVVDIDYRGLMVMEPGGHYDEVEVVDRAAVAADRLREELTAARTA